MIYAASFILLLLSICRYLSVFAAKKNCSLTFPSTGTWLRQSPFWAEKGCLTRSFNATQSEICLSGRTVYIMGISTARQYAYSIHSLLGAEDVDRRQQQARCPSGGGMSWGHGSCNENIKGVKIKYLYYQYLNGYNNSGGGFEHAVNGLTNFINANEVMAHGLDKSLKDFLSKCSKFRCKVNRLPAGSDCEQSPSLCIHNFLENATSSDILLFNGGHVFSSASSLYVDVLGWARQAADDFVNYIGKSGFKGRVFWLSTSRSFQQFEPQNPMIEKVFVILI